MVDGNDGFGYALSLEAGQKLGIGQGWSMTPQAQLAYSSIDFDDFNDAFVAPVSLEQGDSLAGRLGLTLNYEKVQTGQDGKVSGPNQDVPTTANATNQGLIKTMAKAHLLLKMLTDGSGLTIAEVAEASGMHGEDVSRILPLAFLAPKDHRHNSAWAPAGRTHRPRTDARRPAPHLE